MEADKPSSETVDQAAISTSDEQGGSTQQARTYDCTFCKRGFTNAQALGGHMNIHRKDKAKLKKTSSHTLQALEIKSSQEKSPRNYWPAWNFSSEDDHNVNPRDHETHVVQLPFMFAETTSRLENDQGVTSPAGKITEKGLPSSEPELDLELRLGHEFKEPSAAPSTRKFF